MGRPNRGTGSAGPKKSGNKTVGGGKDKYSYGGNKSSSSKSTSNKK